MKNTLVQPLIGIGMLFITCLANAQPLRSGNVHQPHPAEEPAGHYAALGRLDGKPHAGYAAADTKQFDLGCMSARYFNNLKLRAVYVDVPLETFSIGGFPANSSEQARAEIAYLKQLADTARSREQVDEAQAMANVYYRVLAAPGDEDYAAMRRNLFYTGRQLGDWFGPDSLPLTADLMARVWQDATYYIWALKFRYNRTRPYALDSALEHITDPWFPAYPSGHSGNSYVAAYVYSELLPPYKALFEKNAQDMAFSREILGVHFPSDSEAGRLFARQFVNLLLQSPSFLADLAKAKEEIARVWKQQTIPADIMSKKCRPKTGTVCNPASCN